MGYGSSEPGGRNEGAGAKNDSKKSDKGGNNKGGSAGSDKGTSDRQKQGSVSPGGSAADIAKDFGNLGLGGVKTPNASVAQQALPGVFTNKMGITVQRTPTAQKNLMDAVNDYNNVSILERILGIANIGQFNPAVDPGFNAATQNVPNSSWDAVKSALDVAGLFAGAPLGGLYGLGQTGYAMATGEQPTFGKIDIGAYGNTAQPGYGKLPDGSTVDTAMDTSGGFGGLGGFGGTGPGFGGNGDRDRDRSGSSAANSAGIPVPQAPQVPQPTQPGQQQEEPAPQGGPPISLNYNQYNPISIPTYGSWQPVYDQNGQVVGWQNPLNMGIGSA